MNDRKRFARNTLEERGSAEPSTGPRFLVIGRVVKAHGVRGEVRVEPHTDDPARFTWLEEVYVGLEEPRAVAVESVRFHKSWVLVKLEGFESRNEAERLRSAWLQVAEEDALPLEEGEYYLYQVIGLEVTSDEGQYLGILEEVIETKANNVFVVRGPAGEILLPDIDDVVLEIDLDSRQMEVHLLPGLVQ